MSKKPPSKFRESLGRVGERIGRSAGFFLAVLVVLCAIEVAVDWNATLYEINVLRTSLRDKAEHYAELLRKAGENGVLGYDWDELERLSGGLFDDEELVYVRFSDVLGNPIYDRLRPEFATGFYDAHDKTSFRAWYRVLMSRDVNGMLRDPIRLRAKMGSSRHRDFIQAFTDTENRLFAWFSKPAAVHAESPRVLYQDRLSGKGGEPDTSLTWALGAITAEGGETFGVVLVAFSTEKLTRATAAKLWKGLAVTVFFVGLILVQNVLGRRSKLRMQRLEQALAAARAAIGAALPKAPERLGERTVGVAFKQAERLGGTLYDISAVADELELLVVVPEGSGVDAAFASLAFSEAYRRSPAGPPGERLAAALAAYDQSPLARRVAVLLGRIAADGSATGLAAGVPVPARLGSAEEPAATEPTPMNVPRLAAPLVSFMLPAGTGALWLFDDGLSADEHRGFSRAEARARAERTLGKPAPAQEAAEAVVEAGAKRLGNKQTDDLFALIIA
jgi:hypothetical protein